jgi:hypothetical protein
MAISVLQAAGGSAAEFAWWERLIAFIDTPLPYSPFSEYLVLLFILWIVARIARRRRQSFDAQAQEVLDRKYEEGELSRKAYEKYRQDVSGRPKR